MSGILSGLLSGPLESCRDWPKATEIFSRTFSDLYENANKIRTFLEIGVKGIPFAAEEVHKKDLITARKMYHYFKQSSEKGKKPRGYKKHTFENTVKKAQAAKQSLEAAGLIFAHSMLDTALSGLCRAAALNNPLEWKSFIANKEIKLSDYLEGNCYDFVQKAFEKMLATFDFRSIDEKSNILFKICKPEKIDLGPAQFKFSKHKLKNFDRLRHDIVHPTSSEVFIKGVDEWVTFAYNTSMYFIDMVHVSKKLYVDEKQMLSFIFSTGAMRRQSNKQMEPSGKAAGSF